MTRGLPRRLLTDRVTIRKPVQSMVAGTRKPVFEFQDLASGVPARFDPGGTALSRNVLGQTPKRTLKLFLNPTDLKENYLVVDEATGKTYMAVEVKDIFGRHIEVSLEEKR